MQTRELAAIMFTDIVSYTSIMGRDEQLALDLISKNRNLQIPVIRDCGGQVIKEMGDGLMSRFNSVLQAVTAAIKIQDKCREDYEFQLRIGIHLGEVLVENNDILGDGVNIASRIQSISEPGTIYVSDSVQKNIMNKKDFRTTFVAEAELKNVEEPVKIYQVTSNTNMQKDVNGKTLTHNVAYNNSIAVLPFLNLSQDTEQNGFCEGISEEILLALSQLNNLRVISRTAVSALKGKNLVIVEIGKTLGVNTLLEGSVRKSGNKVRINTNLVQVSDGSHLWSHRYDRELEDIFSIQDDIAQNVATAVRGYLTSTEKEIIRRPETNIEAYTLFLKGRQQLHQISLEKAAILFEKAIQLDPTYAPAFAGLSAVYGWKFEWEGGKSKDLEAAEHHSRMALTLAPEISESHSSRAYVLSLGKNFDEAEVEFNKAVELNTNSFDAYYYYGRSCFARGDILKSAELFLKASQVRLEDFQSLILLGQSLEILGDEKAEEMKRLGEERTRKQLQLDPDYKRALAIGASNLMGLGKKEEAFQRIERALEIYPDDPDVLINGACTYAVGGDKEKALDLLERSFGKGYGKKDWILHDPDYDSLREEPRFQVLLEKLP